MRERGREGGERERGRGGREREAVGEKGEEEQQRYLSLPSCAAYIHLRKVQYAHLYKLCVGVSRGGGETIRLRERS